MMLPVRNLSKCLLLTALLSGAVSTAVAINPPYGDNLNYAMDGTTLVLTSPNPAQPATIYASAFLDSTNITAVIFPDNLRDISSCAFQGCTSLREIVIPPSVTNIGENAFYGCSSLVSVLCRPQSAPTMGGDAFAGCNASLQICVPSLGAYSHTDWDTFYGEKLSLCFLDENDEQSVASGKISTFSVAEVSSIDIFRTLRKVGSFNTLCLPFNVPDIASSPLAGAEVYTFSSATVVGNTLQLTITPLEGSALTAGTPYLIKWDSGSDLNHMHFEGISWDDDQSAETVSSTNVNYVGFYGKTQISYDTNHSNLFLAGSNTLYWPAAADNSSMLGFRAYFQVNTPANAPVYRGMPVSFNIVSTPTEIETVSEESSPGTRKVMRDGQLIIIHNGVSYSITGQRL